MHAHSGVDAGIGRAAERHRQIARRAACASLRSAAGTVMLSALSTARSVPGSRPTRVAGTVAPPGKPDGDLFVLLHGVLGGDDHALPPVHAARRDAVGGR